VLQKTNVPASSGSSCAPHAHVGRSAAPPSAPALLFFCCFFSALKRSGARESRFGFSSPASASANAKSSSVFGFADSAADAEAANGMSEELRRTSDEDGAHSF
jgi:hypothetical protein